MKPRPLKLFVSAGEPSGDALLAGALKTLHALHSQPNNLSETQGDEPELLLCGVGGPLSAEQGLVSCLRFEELAVNGVGDVLRALPRLVLAARKLEKALLDFDPDAVLLVDYPGMNVRLWRLTRKLGKPVHYLAPPQLWSRRSASALALRYAPLARGSTLQVLFPFEAELWQRAGARVLQGHPFETGRLHVSDVLPESKPNPSILFCPGSRPRVIRRNLKAYLRAFHHLQQSHSGFVNPHPRIRVLVPEPWRSLAEEEVANAEVAGAHVSVVTDKHAIVNHPIDKPTLALCQPGTMTLELTLAGIPFMAVGMVDALTLVLGKYRVATPHLALPNVLLGERLYPEWVGLSSQFTGDVLAKLLLALNQAIPHLPAARSDLITAMGSGGSGQVAAESLLQLLGRLALEKSYSQ